MFEAADELLRLVPRSPPPPPPPPLTIVRCSFTVFLSFFFLVLSILLQSCPENKVLTATVTFNFHLAEGCIVFIWKDFFFSTVLLLIVFSLFAKDLCSTVSRYNSQLAVEQLAPLLLLSTVCVVATDTVSCTTAHTMVDFTGFFKHSENKVRSAL